jgi:hypothetical protein
VIFLILNFLKKCLVGLKGGIIEDGVWAKYWYENVHNSTRFQSKKKNSQEEMTLPVKYNSLFKEASFYYDALKNI